MNAIDSFLIRYLYSGRAKFWKGQGANYQYEGTVRAKLCYEGISSKLFCFKRASQLAFFSHLQSFKDTIVIF